MGVRLWGPTLAAFLAAVGVGFAAAKELDELLVLILIPVGVALALRLSLAGWIISLLCTAVLSRGFVTLAHLPNALVFLHYPLTLMFGVVAVIGARKSRSHVDHAWIRWSLALAGVVIVTAIAAVTHPARVALFVLIAGQAAIIAGAVAIWPKGEELRSVRVAFVALFLLQVPFVVAQIQGSANADLVRGSLLGHGAGAHVLGGLMALAIFVCIDGLRQGTMPVAVAAAFFVFAVITIYVADAKQVAVAAVAGGAIAWAAESMAGRAPKGRLVLRRAAVLLTGTLAVGLVLGPVQQARVTRLTTSGQLPIVQTAQEAFDAGANRVLFGVGPGQGASRASILLTPQMLKPGSPLAALGLEPTQDARKIVSATLSEQAGGSLESFSSGFASVFVDLGIAGSVVVALFVVWLWRRLGHHGPLAFAGRAAIAMTLILSVVDVWFEYPEFAVPLGVLVGLGIRNARQESAQMERRTGRAT